MASAEYIKTPLGEGVRFNVTPAPKALGGCAGVIVILVLSLLGGIPVMSVTALVLTPVTFWMGDSVQDFISVMIGIGSVIGVAYFLFKKLDLRKKNHKKPSEFTVKPDAVQVDGKKISKTDIHRIVIRNAYDNTPRIQLTGQPVSTGSGIGHDIRNALEQISYSVDVEAGGKATQLAGGLDSTTAYGLLTDVSTILGLQVNDHL